MKTPHNRVLPGKAFVDKEANSIDGVMDVLCRRFCHYGKLNPGNRRINDHDSLPILDEENICEMLRDMFNLRNYSRAARKLLLQMDTHRNGYVTYDEFVSYVSLSWRELCQIGLRLKEHFHLNRKNDWKKIFSALAQSIKGQINVNSLMKMVESTISISLTPGETHTLSLIIGNTYDKFFQFMEDSDSDDDDHMKSFLNKKCPYEKGPIVQIAVSGKASQENNLERQGFEKIHEHLRKSLGSKNTYLWIKRQRRKKTKKQKPMEKGEHSDSESEDGESCTSSECSDSRSSSESETENSDSDSDYRQAEPSSSRVITQVAVIPFCRDAGLVADGFACVEKPLNGGASVSTNRFANRLYLWYKTETPLESRRNHQPTSKWQDPIFDFAVTNGSCRDLKSKVWCPPFRGFKRIDAKISKGYFASDTFIWYLKEDTTYKKEVASERLSYRYRLQDDKAGSLKRDITFTNALCERVREQVREHLSSQAAERRVRFQVVLNELLQPNKIFKGIASQKQYLTKKDFVRVMHNVGIQLDTKDVASMFNQLDATENGLVHKDDVVDFFMLNDEELFEISQKLRKQILSEKGKSNYSLSTIFKKLDKNKDGKLSAKEFEAALNRADIRLTSTELQRLVDFLDSDGSGYVEFKEFAAFVKKRNDFASLKKKQKVHGKEVRRAARILYDFSIKRAVLGSNSGRIEGVTPNWERAWKRLAEQGEMAEATKNDCISRGVLNAFFLRKGCRLRPQDLDHLLKAIASSHKSQPQPQPQPQQSSRGSVQRIEYGSFVNFVSNYVPNEASQKRQPVTLGETPRRERAARLRSTLKALKRGLEEHRSFSRNPEECNFLSFFGWRNKTKVPANSFVKALLDMEEHRGLSAAAAETIAMQLDNDNDGWIKNQDFSDFISRKRSHETRNVADCKHSVWETSESESSCQEEESVLEDSASGYSDIEEKQDLGPATSRGGEFVGNGSIWWLDNDVDELIHAKEPKAGLVGKQSQSMQSMQQTYQRSSDRIYESNVRKRWSKHLDRVNKIKSSQQLSGVGRTVIESGLDFHQLHAAIEEAVEFNGNPLELSKQFSRYDHRGKGYISAQHFKKVLSRNHICIPPSIQSSLARVLECTSSSDSKKKKKSHVDYKTFCKLVAPVSRNSPGSLSGFHTRVRAIFNDSAYMYACETFDRFGEGRISVADFEKALKMADIELHRQDLKQLLPILDIKDNGWVYYPKIEEIVETGKDLVDNQKKERNTRHGKAITEMEFAQLKISQHLQRNLGAEVEHTNFIDYFQDFDVAGHGTLSVRDFSACLGSLLDEKRVVYSGADLEKIGTLYCDSANQVNYIEFVDFLNAFIFRASNGRNSAVIERLKKHIHEVEARYGVSFENLLAENDMEDSGKISRLCLKQCLSRLGVKLEPFELLEVFDVANTDGDLLVDYKELASLILSQPFVDVDDLRQRIQKKVLESNLGSSSFDLRRIFHSPVGDRLYLSEDEFRNGIKKLRIPFNESEVSCIFEYLKNSERNIVHIDDICEFCDFDEEKYDAIAKRCYDRFLALERQGIYIREEFGHYSKENEWVSLEDFTRIVQLLGLPITKVELWLLLKRFLNPNHKSEINYRLFIEFVLHRQQQS